MKKWIALGLFGVVSVVAACSGKSSGGPYSSIDPNNGGSGAVYTGGYGGTGGTLGNTGGTSANADPKAPIVEIIAPVAVDDPTQDGVVVENEVDVVCSVNRSIQPGSTDVDTSTVSVEMFSAEGESIEKKKAAATPNAHEFSASFVLTDVPNGRVSFRCSAEDSNSPPLTSTTGINTFVDHGPKITVISPVPGSAFTAVEGDVPVEFKVEPAPLSADDDNAGVEVVTFRLGGIDITPTPDPTESGTYRFNISLNALTSPPTGETTVQITASNRRTPTPAERLETYSFIIDGKGPTITVQAPVDKIVVGNHVKMEFTVVDQENAAGVDENSVVVSINDQDYPFDLTQGWKRDGDKFTFEFDSTTGNSKVQVTVNIRAADKVGNASTGTSLLLYLDNVPPMVDLDPANVREGDVLTGQCSTSFDPVGTAAVNDLDGSFGLTPDFGSKHFPIAGAARFRAFVFEETNHAQGVSIVYYAGTDPANVRLYVQPNPSAQQAALLIDKNADGVCDEIGEDASINFSVMDKVATGGGIQYGMDTAVAPDPAGTCTLKAETLPNTLCDRTSDMWRVLRHDKASASETTVYSVKVGAGAVCTGNDWEFGTYADADGWVCFAARAVDKVGNVGISRPIRVCMDDPDRAGVPPCQTSSTIPPSCTDGCTPPPRANPGIMFY